MSSAAYMPAASGKVVSLNRDAMTDDIRLAYEDYACKYAAQARQLAAYLRRRGDTPQAYANRVHRWIRDHVKYIMDPDGVQGIKTPARTVSDGFGDCKSYSILGTALLRCAGYDAMIRSTSYDENPDVTHTYPCLVANGQCYPIDPCLSTPGYEKPFTFKVDTPMAKLIGMHGPGDAQPSATLRALNAERARREADIVARTLGATNPRAIEAANFAAMMDRDSISGVSGPFDKILNVLSAPARKIAQEVLEKVLPKIAPLFLLIFLKDPQAIARLAPRKQKARAAAVKLAGFIINRIKLPEAEFMTLVRNGIMKESGKTPEQIFADRGFVPASTNTAPITVLPAGDPVFSSGGLGTKKVSGVGFLPLLAPLVPIIIEWVPKIVALFGGKKEDAGNLADLGADDWSESLFADGQKSAQQQQQQSGGPGPLVVIPSTPSQMPGWVIPAAAGAALLLFMGGKKGRR